MWYLKCKPSIISVSIKNKDMQRNNLLFKYVHTVKEKNLPSFSRVGIKSEQRDWFMDISSAATLWQKLGWKRTMKNSKSSRDCSYRRRKQEGKSGLWLLEICWWLKNKSLDTTNFSTGVCTCKSGRQNTCQFDCCMEMRMYSNSNSAYQHFYESDSYPNNAYYVKDPYSENRRDLFPL